MYTCIHQKPTGGNQVYNVYKFVHLAKVINLIKVSQLMPGIYTVKKNWQFSPKTKGNNSETKSCIKIYSNMNLICMLNSWNSVNQMFKEKVTII